jgi:hypothetical protein
MMGDRSKVESQIQIIGNAGSGDALTKELYERSFDSFELSREPLPWTAKDIADYKKQNFIREHAPKYIMRELPQV